MRKIIIPIVILAAVGGLAYWKGPEWWQEENGAQELRVSGNIEAQEAVLSFKIPGRIEELRVEEGEWVEAGAVLARLDDSDYRQQVALDRATFDVTEAQLNLVLAGARPQEIEGAEQSVRELEIEKQQRELDLERATALLSKDAGSQQMVDQARTALGRIEAVLARAREQLSQLREGARPEEVAIARANVSRAREGLRMSRIRLEQTELRAPTNGVVLIKQGEVGEVLAPGSPVLTLGNLEEVWLRAYVPETELGRIRHGQEVKVSIDTFPDRTFRGRISFISSKAEFTPKTIETYQERVKLVYRIKIDVENPDLELKPGMPADALIPTGEALQRSAADH